MARGIISNFTALVERFPELAAVSPEHPRSKALQTYFKKGGVVSAVQGGQWPRLVYPNADRLKKQIAELNEAVGVLNGKKKDWQKTFFDARIYNIKNKVMKFLDPLYWQHVGQSVMDKDYRSDAQAVHLPVQMVAEPKYRPMINMFVKDIEYRKQLTETVQHSIVYRKDKRVAKYAQDLREFRMDTSNKNIEALDRKLAGLEEELNALQVLFKWVTEK